MAYAEQNGAAEGLARIERLSFAERAYAAIRESIIGGRFRPGEQLVEARLASELDVSRGPVREALKRLREEGLVVDSVHRGVYVRVFTVDDIVDLYNIRVGLESVAIRLATRLRSATIPLRESIDGMHAAASAGDFPLLNARELAFHEALCEMSRNRYVSSLFRSISGQVRIAFSLDNAEYSDAHEVAREHVPLVEAIESGDEDLAVRLIGQHVVGSLAPALDRLAGAEEAARASARLLVQVEDGPRR
jgi:GntR family transcriptional regulator of gluconate operon